ncbi:hypothetical protein N9P40_01745 [Planktomarina temperata]|nr:hypothetical protein [Planktomarina temperata]
MPIELATPWCKMVQIDAESLIMPKTTSASEDKYTHRLSVSLSSEQHLELSEIAYKNRVSVAWVVRESIDRLLKDDMPLLHVGKGQ